MSVYVLRHGQTDWNKKGIVQGRTDTPLNETGIAQAKEIKAELDQVDFKVCYCSPLLRAKQTAGIVLEGRPVPIVYDPRIVEMAYGAYEATHWMGEGYQASRRLLAYRHKGGESYFDVAHRAFSFLDEVCPGAKDANILVVCHGGVARVIDAYFRDDATNDQFIDNICPNGKYRVYEVPERNVPLIVPMPEGK